MIRVGRGDLGHVVVKCQQMSHPIAFRTQVPLVLGTGRNLERRHRHLKSSFTQGVHLGRVVREQADGRNTGISQNRHRRAVLTSVDG